MENGNQGYDLYGLYGAGLNGSGTGGSVPQQQFQQQPQQQTGRYVAQPAQSTQMVRRNPNQQVMQQQQPGFLQSWQGLDDGLGDAQGMSGAGAAPGSWENSDEEDDLDAKAMKAKKDAQNKRKQIPPFVQKLRSFLDESRNTDLIRWSDDGNAFIVVDEDEFAKTLIPELFKHNNYPSFVRQLNMYGFHKKVGLTDNSMRASEQKKKLPSVYFNKYFKRGRPELLWLIQKPKSSTSGGKRKRDDKSKGEVDSDDEIVPQGMDMQGLPVDGGGGTTNKQLIMRNSSEISTIRNELQMMQRQQKYILNVIQQLKRQNDQFYQQATAYQQLHERHENSINAILTFLATFYNRSLDKNGPDIADIFSHALPGKQQPQHGTVVDVGEGDLPDLKANPSPQFQRRRPLALLPAPELDTNTPGTAATIPSTSRSSTAISPGVANQTHNLQVRPGSRGHLATPTQAQSHGLQSPVVKTDAETPNLSQIPDADDFISSINNSGTHQAFDSPNMDFSSALSQIQSANNQAPLTPQERDNMLAMMANNAGNSGVPLTDNSNNALVSPTPPSFPPLDDIASARNQIDILEKMQEEQARRVTELADRLQPLSPNGTIPGLADEAYPFNSSQVMGNPGEWDLDSFIQPDDYFPNVNADGHADLGNSGMPNGDTDFGDFDFGLNSYGGAENGKGDDGVGGGNGNNGAVHSTGFLGDEFGEQGRVESVSSSATSPAATIGGDEDGERSTLKKRRVR